MSTTLNQETLAARISVVNVAFNSAGVLETCLAFNPRILTHGRPAPKRRSILLPILDPANILSARKRAKTGRLFARNSRLAGCRPHVPARVCE